jgi:hypothetical protein
VIQELLQRAGLHVHGAAEPEPTQFDRFHNLLSLNSATVDQKLLRVQDLQIKIDAGAVRYGHREQPTPHWTITVLGKRKDTTYTLEVGYVHGSKEQYKLEYNHHLLASWLVNNNHAILNINDLMRVAVAGVVAHFRRERPVKAQAATEPAEDQDAQKVEQWQRILDFFAQPRRVTYKRDGRVFIVSRQPRPYQGPKWCVQIQLEGNRSRSVRFRLDYTYYHDLVIHATYCSLTKEAPGWDFGVIRNPAALLDPQQFVAAAVHHVDNIQNHAYAFQPEPSEAEAATEPLTDLHQGWHWLTLTPKYRDLGVMRKVQMFCVRKHVAPMMTHTSPNSYGGATDYTIYFNDEIPNLSRRYAMRVLLAVAKKFGASPELLQDLAVGQHISSLSVHPESEAGRWLRKRGFWNDPNQEYTRTSARALDLVRQAQAAAEHRTELNPLEIETEMEHLKTVPEYKVTNVPGVLEVYLNPVENDNSTDEFDQIGIDVCVNSPEINADREGNSFDYVAVDFYHKTKTIHIHTCRTKSMAPHYSKKIPYTETLNAARLMSFIDNEFRHHGVYQTIAEEAGRYVARKAAEARK